MTRAVAVGLLLLGVVAGLVWAATLAADQASRAVCAAVGAVL